MDKDGGIVLFKDFPEDVVLSPDCRHGCMRGGLGSARSRRLLSLARVLTLVRPSASLRSSIPTHPVSEVSPFFLRVGPGCSRCGLERGEGRSGNRDRREDLSVHVQVCPIAEYELWRLERAVDAASRGSQLLRRRGGLGALGRGARGVWPRDGSRREKWLEVGVMRREGQGGERDGGEGGHEGRGLAGKYLGRSSICRQKKNADARVICQICVRRQQRHRGDTPSEETPETERSKEEARRDEPRRERKTGHTGEHNGA
ncbi:hypothetical protein TGARI_368590 [Toxoplasma gondii ARI]|uniref:Uncharacterized protein n=1 Tax=Toxoplasma gondii ARI TaxID=1074872 RepID=A0A139Y7K3_TOXGO|nr:hypothetical protein TGARI_368590 [Toxoplasma gondii ARI]